MKKAIFLVVCCAFASNLALGVTIDWKQLVNVSIGEIETRKFQTDPEGSPEVFTYETSIQFQGSNLVYLLKLLPKVYDHETSQYLSDHRMLEISGPDEKSIQIRCVNSEFKKDKKVSIPNGPKCEISITKGPQAG